jgi:hypothetical protein
MQGMVWPLEFFVLTESSGTEGSKPGLERRRM